jgi:phenylacetate-coenzyme A ligase PaaK-like adenylate-forming protein
VTAGGFEQGAAAFVDALFTAVLDQLPRVHWDAATLADHRRAELARTLAWAAQQSPWHRERLADVDLDAVTPDDLTALPTMTKTDVMAHWDEVVTDGDLSLDAARRHLQRLDDEGPAFFGDSYLIFTTGGSTGEPAIFPWSIEEFASFGASSIRFRSDAGIPPPERMACVGARSPRHPTAWPSLLFHGLEEGSARIIPVDQPVDAIVAALNAADPDQLLTIGSMLPVLAEAKADGRLHITPTTISVGSDAADPAAVDAAEAAFGVRPADAYPTTDVGYVACQPPGEDGMVVNEDLLLVEVVDEDDRPVPDGDVGHHLLVTSLHQRTLPLIRYRIDDRIRLGAPAGRYPAYRRVLEIDGRADDVFHYGEARLHPHVVRSVLSRYPEVPDHQVRQTERGIEVLVAGPPPEGLEPDLRAALATAGLRDPEVRVAEVATIPRSPLGKRLRFVALR